MKNKARVKVENSPKGKGILNCKQLCWLRLLSFENLALILSRGLPLLFNMPPTGTHAVRLGVGSTVRAIIA